MQWFAAFLAVVAIVLFLVHALANKHWALGFGLSFLTAAWMVQLIVNSGVLEIR